jgi:hypothetical protein
MANDILTLKPLQITGLIETAKILKSTDKNLIKELKKDLAEGIEPVANKIQLSVPSDAPLSGMVHNGRSRWDVVKVRVSFTPGAAIRGRQYQPLISLVVTGKKGLGFDYAELAGINRRKPAAKSRSWTDRYGNIRRTTQNGQGAAFTTGLGGEPGRYAFATVKNNYPEIKAKTIDIIEGYATQINHELRVR